MPTKRTWGFLLLAVVLYFLANQTQVGWIYVITSGIVGLVIVSFFYSRGMLTRITARRSFKSLVDDDASAEMSRHESLADNTDLSLQTLYEDDPVEVTLQFQQTGLRPAFLVYGDEVCPFAPPNEQARSLFIPNLFKNRPVHVRYQTTCDRRGYHRFHQLPLRANGPFGFFGTRHMLAAPAEILIYPYYHPLDRLRLLETRELAERQTARVGVGTQVVGTREYRTGDSLRQIHWRSTARTGKLVVKEFAEEDQPSLTVALDMEKVGGPDGGKYSTFETAIRMAASLGSYATRHDIPFRLVGSSPKWRPPTSALGWWAVLNYLAKIENDGVEPLSQVIESLPPLPFLVVLVSQPNPVVVRALNTVCQKGTPTLAIFITPDGTLPPDIQMIGGVGLDMAVASPHNWAGVLEAL